MFTGDPEWERVVLAWAKYYATTELFDRMFPGMWDPHDPDVWMVEPGYRRRSTRHARNRYMELCRELADVQEELVQRGKEHVVGLKHAQHLQIMREGVEDGGRNNGRTDT